MSVLHSKQTTAQGIHVMVALEFSDETARLNGVVSSPAGHVVTYEDIGKLCKQITDSTYWIIDAVSPSITYVLIGQPSGSVVFPSLMLTAGAGLIGGGDLTTDRTFNVSANADGSITVNANDIQVGILATDAQHGNRGGGSLHSIVSGSTAGFMSAADKVFLDALVRGNITTPVRNETGGTLLKGSAVVNTGWDSPTHTTLVAYADKDNTTLNPAIGILAADLLDQTIGVAVVQGLIEGLDTRSFVLTDQLAIGNAGQLILAPDGPAYTGAIQNVGTVLRVHPSDGHILVMLDGREALSGEQQGALSGTNGIASLTNKYVTDSDPRNSNARVANGMLMSNVTIVLSSSIGPTPGQLLTATTGSMAKWADPVAVLTSSPPANVTKTAADVGVATDSARADHKHDITTDVGTTWCIGVVGAEGSSTSLARADHIHYVSSSTAPVNITKATAAIGVSNAPARSDHKHDITTSTPTATAIHDTTSEGIASSLARSDHRHSVAAAAPVNIGIENTIGTASTFACSDHIHNLPFTPIVVALGTLTSSLSLNNQNLINIGRLNGIQYYPTSSTDPVSPTPVDGDRYYNTILHEFTTYDGFRSKWLTTTQLTLQSGGSGNTITGSFFRGSDGLAYGTNIGHPVPKGTLIGLLISMTTTVSSSVEVLIDTTVIATLPVTTAGLTADMDLNADFSQGLMKFRNKAPGDTMTDVQITALLKRRI